MDPKCQCDSLQADYVNYQRIFSRRGIAFSEAPCGDPAFRQFANERLRELDAAIIESWCDCTTDGPPEGPHVVHMNVMVNLFLTFGISDLGWQIMRSFDRKDPLMKLIPGVFPFAHGVLEEIDRWADEVPEIISSPYAAESRSEEVVKLSRAAVVADHLLLGHQQWCRETPRAADLRDFLIELGFLRDDIDDEIITRDEGLIVDPFLREFADIVRAAKMHADELLPRFTVGTAQPSTMTDLYTLVRLMRLVKFGTDALRGWADEEEFNLDQGSSFTGFSDDFGGAFDNGGEFNTTDTDNEEDPKS